jgi:MFS family permease
MTTKPPPPKSPGPTTRAAGRWWALALLAAVFGCHVCQAIRLFPTLKSIVDPASPVVVVDHAIHEYHGALGARFLREHGTTWGFDPFFMAGYPETPVWDSSSNPAILFNALGGGNDYRAYKVGLFAASVLLLVLIAAGAWAAGLGMAEVALATTLAWIYFWTGFSIWVWRSGLFAFIVASAGVGLLLGLCTWFDRRPTRRGWCALVVVGAGLFFVHVTAFVLAAGGALAFYVTVARRHGWRWHAALLGAAALAVAVNGPWLATLWQFRKIRTDSGPFMTTDSVQTMIEYFLRHTPDSRLGLLLLALGSAGLIRWWFRGLRSSSMAFGGSIVALMILTFFGSQWGPTRALEPLRFRIPCYFLLVVPAASAIAGATAALARWVGGGRKGVLAAGFAWLVTLASWAAADSRVALRVKDLLTTDRPLVVGLTPEMKVMVGWLKANTDVSARILFEDQLRLFETTDPESVHWTPLLPFLLQPDVRLFIGGLYQTAFIRYHEMAAFGDFQLGNRSIDAWPEPDLKRYCDMYNVGWVVCWSPLSRFWFDRFGPATRVATLPRLSSPDQPVSGNEHEWTTMIRLADIDVARRYMLGGERAYAIYRLDRPRTYFLRGKGRIISVEPNRIELADVEPDGGAVVLSLHWLDTWRTDPPLTLRPEPAPPDPVDFVRIELPGPIPRLVLSNGYGRR